MPCPVAAGSKSISGLQGSSPVTRICRTRLSVLNTSLSSEAIMLQMQSNLNLAKARRRWYAFLEYLLALTLTCGARQTTFGQILPCLLGTGILPRTSHVSTSGVGSRTMFLGKSWPYLELYLSNPQAVSSCSLPTSMEKHSRSRSACGPPGQTRGRSPG